MIRNSFNFKVLRQSQKYLFTRVFSAQPAVTEKSSTLNEEWAKAKPYSEIPALTKFEMVRAFLPGGKYHNIDMVNLTKKLLEEYGKLVIMPGVFGRPPIVMTFEPEDFEKVFRNDSIWPHRKSLETLEYYRSTIRPDIYAEYGGLFNGSDY